MPRERVAAYRQPPVTADRPRRPRSADVRPSRKQGSRTVNDRWYFAYGSNLAMDQNRTGLIREARRARLDGYRIAFNKLGSDGTGKANLVPDETAAVWGVVYLCSAATLDQMDLYEGVPRGHYYRKNVRVHCDSGEQVNAVTYIAGNSFIRPSLQPAPEYLQQILRGAREHRLPDSYLQEIERVAQGDG